MPSPETLRLGHLHQARQQILTHKAVRQVHRRWGLVDPANIVATWRSLLSAVTAIVAAYQTEAARGADGYVGTALVLDGVTPDPAGLTVATAFAGYASDGRDLAGLLEYPSFQAVELLSRGMDPGTALTYAGRSLDRMVATQVQDAARVATGVAIVNDRRTAGFIRMVSASACSRCVVLAGVWYRYDAGFARHPNCSCIGMPAAEVITPQSPRELFDAMSPEQLKRSGWSDADVQAINDGADIAQVTNAHRDLRSVSVAGRTIKTTLQGATRRGLAGQRLGAKRGRTAIRLTPESIYAEAARLGWSRDETIRQLKRHGYIL